MFFKEFCNKLEKGNRAIVERNRRLSFFFLLLSDMTNLFVDREDVNKRGKNLDCRRKE